MKRKVMQVVGVVAVGAGIGTLIYFAVKKLSGGNAFNRDGGAAATGATIPAQHGRPEPIQAHGGYVSPWT